MPDSYLSDLVKALVSKDDPNAGKLQRDDGPMFKTPTLENAQRLQEMREWQQRQELIEAEQRRIAAGGVPDVPDAPRMFWGQMAPEPGPNDAWRADEDFTRRAYWKAHPVRQK